MRNFNVTGLCVPGRHYMADTGEKISRIMQFVDNGYYLNINLGRQYGKTTTLALLDEHLSKKYSVIRISFEDADDEMFKTAQAFCQGLLSLCSKYLCAQNLSNSDDWVDSSVTDFDPLNDFLNKTINYFVSEQKTANNLIISDSLIKSITAKEHFDMPLFLEKFANHYYEIYRERDVKFLERECRLLFITYLVPYINGTGFYHLESETRDGERTDVVIDYLTEQFIVELKLWYGEVAHEDAYEQLFGYLDSKNKGLGYLLTFDFRKTENVGKPQINWVERRGKKILDVMVGF